MRRRRRSASAQAVERSFEAANARAKARAGLTAIAIFLVFASVVGVLWYGAQDVLSGLDDRRAGSAVRALCGARGDGASAA